MTTKAAATFTSIGLRRRWKGKSIYWTVGVNGLSGRWIDANVKPIIIGQIFKIFISCLGTPGATYKYYFLEGPNARNKGFLEHEYDHKTYCDAAGRRSLLQPAVASRTLAMVKSGLPTERTKGTPEQREHATHCWGSVIEGEELFFANQKSIFKVYISRAFCVQQGIPEKWRGIKSQCKYTGSATASLTRRLSIRIGSNFCSWLKAKYTASNKLQLILMERL